MTDPWYILRVQNCSHNEALAMPNGVINLKLVAIFFTNQKQKHVIYPTAVFKCFIKRYFNVCQFLKPFYWCQYNPSITKRNDLYSLKVNRTHIQ